jgi:hypothetical protein
LRPSQGGGDGAFTYWDYKAKQRLKQCEGAGAPVVDVAMNPRGNLCAYACSYDWSQGPKPAAEVGASTGLFVRVNEDAAITPKNK